MECKESSKYYLINAFTKEEFKGNPAAVVLLTADKSDEWMKSFAKEINQPITAFISTTNDNKYKLRWFTPTQEIDLCGHGTLGAAHILWSERVVRESTKNFTTRSGILQTELSGQQIIMRLKLKESCPIDVSENLQQVINFPIKAAAWAEDRYIIELENQNMIHKAAPNFDLIKELNGPGIIITSRGSDKYDFVSRYFAPKIGIKEDFVTGSAHCALASYWRKLLNKTDFTAYQDSERGGEIRLRVMDGTVELIGDSVTLLRGQLCT
ncbi:hypothetical protein AF332_27315 [Sporosarcina globispora]|uniref:Phenazine biosynthesis protein PhzF family n=1 Tax=Sporosarcina globispora TaxID=1459 RepID=A0A0M0GJP4_SPOGL|nr:PhzF family phenazine biosynthesis protein [Sporosarcina globispora]KON90145.1 hypothetical protein AF332_27315 [Sporosarcina globispora]